MRYFTSEWWQSARRGPDPVVEAYAAHFASIRESLPAALVELEDAHTLHDARVENVTCEVSDGRLELVLNGWDMRLQQPIRYRLAFSEVSRFEQTFPSGRNVGPELGDLGYWECDLSPAGCELRMLFASSAEFCVVFKGFTFSCAPSASGVGA